MATSAGIRAKKQNIQGAILGSLAVGGILPLDVVALNSLRSLEYAQKPRTYASRFQRALLSLSGRGYVTLTDDRKAHITNKGTKRFHALSHGRFHIEAPASWDGLWRIVMFDIPERSRSARDKLRFALERIGFIKLQDSVWIYPYDCEALIDVLKTEYLIGREVQYIVANKIAHDRALRKRFALPLR